MLWDKTIPAERKIMEMESGIMLPERTEILAGADNIARLTIESIPHVMGQLDNCLDSNTPASRFPLYGIRLNGLRTRR